MNIKIMTMQGKRRTTPSGIEMDEFPFSRILRLSTDSLGANLSFCRDKSSKVGRFGEEGIRLTIL